MSIEWPRLLGGGAGAVFLPLGYKVSEQSPLLGDGMMLCAAALLFLAITGWGSQKSATREPVGSYLDPHGNDADTGEQTHPWL